MPKQRLEGLPWAFPVLSSLEAILLGACRGGGGGSEAAMEGRGRVTVPMRVPAYMLPHTGGRTDATDKFPRMQGRTETQDAVPLPYSKEEPWTQTLGSPAHRDTNTCVHTSLRCVVQKTRKRFSR